MHKKAAERIKTETFAMRLSNFHCWQIKCKCSRHFQFRFLFFSVYLIKYHQTVCVCPNFNIFNVDMMLLSILHLLFTVSIAFSFFSHVSWNENYIIFLLFCLILKWSKLLKTEWQERRRKKKCREIDFISVGFYVCIRNHVLQYAMLI